MKITWLLLLTATFAAVSAVPIAQTAMQPPRHNVIIFVADGLRHGSVNAQDSPTLLSIRRKGVYFKNSHSLFPTFTTANASAIATGHYLGDTGDFSNTIYTGHPLFSSGNFGRQTGNLGTVTPFLEDDQRLGDIDEHFGGDYLGEETLMKLARRQGYRTAVVGKLGPSAIQDVEELVPEPSDFAEPETIIIDDSTGKQDPPGHNLAPPLNPDVLAAMKAMNIDAAAPNRSNGCGSKEPCNNGFSGTNDAPGTTSPNVQQQKYFADVTTRVILPRFAKSGKPFLLLFWSRDPDGTQHNQGDSLHSLKPGINGPTSRKAVKNADDNLKQIVDFIAADPQLKNNTDIIVTSDHGFATISRFEIDGNNHHTASLAAQRKYVSADGKPEIPDGHLPTGFLALDLAQALNLGLFDPDKPAPAGSGQSLFQKVNVKGEPAQRPSGGNGLIGNEIHRADGSDAKVIVAANGGSDLIYIPDHDKARVRAIVGFLSQQDYVGGVFVDTENYGKLKGALPMRSIGLIGAAVTPRPAIVVAFKVFYQVKGDLQSAVQIADTTLQEGQGMHGGFGRDSTFNNMAATGPDFKSSYTDPAPVSNADIAPTVAHIMRAELPVRGTVLGRVLVEALSDGPRTIPFVRKTLTSPPSSGSVTALDYQQVGRTSYFDDACFVKTRRKPGQPGCAY